MQVLNLKGRLKYFFCDRVFTALTILTVALVLGALFAMAVHKTGVSIVPVNSTGTDLAGEIYDGTDLTLDFVSPKDGLTGISFTVSTYGRELTSGTLTISLSDEAGTMISQKDFEGSELKDQTELTVSFIQQKNTKDKAYIVQITTSGIDQSHAISFPGNNSIIEGVSTQLNGTSCSNLLFSLKYIVVYPFYNYRYAFDLVLAAGFFFVLATAAYRRNRPKNISNGNSGNPTFPI